MLACNSTQEPNLQLFRVHGPTTKCIAHQVSCNYRYSSCTDLVNATSDIIYYIYIYIYRVMGGMTKWQEKLYQN